MFVDQVPNPNLGHIRPSSFPEPSAEDRLLFTSGRSRPRVRLQMTRTWTPNKLSDRERREWKQQRRIPNPQISVQQRSDFHTLLPLLDY